VGLVSARAAPHVARRAPDRGGRARARAWLLALALTGCAGSPACRAPVPGGSAGVAPSTSVSPAATGSARGRSSAATSASARVPGVAGGWVEAVRALDWSEAARRLDGLPEAERRAPEVRYVRARAARELGEPARAASLLADLEPALPLLADAIAAERAAAWLAAGQHQAAAAYYARRSDATSLLALAYALEGAGELARARDAAERALQRLLADRRREADQAEVRALRARLAAAQGDRVNAAAIYRWLAIHVPTSPHAAGADLRAAELAPKQALTQQERLQRALAFARAGDVAATEQEVERLATAPGAAVPEGERLFARGLARYHARRDLAVAAELLTRAASLDAAHRSRDLYTAARAVARGFDDRRALALFGDLVRRFPRAPEAEDARFQIARTHLVLGEYPAAIAGYTEYLARHGRTGDRVESARYERAVARLAGGDGARAEPELAALLREQPDELLRASYRELRGAALLAAGQRAEAEAELRAVVAEAPLSLAALLAAARLRALGVAPPPLIAPPPPEAPAPPLALDLPPRVALLVRLGLDTDAEAALAAEEAALRRRFGERGDEAVCLAYAELSVATRRLVAGRKAAAWKTLLRAPSPRTRWLWDCLYPRPYGAIVAAAEREEHLPAYLVHAVMRQESAFDPAAESPARAVGLLQLIPSTAEAIARELAVEHDPARLVAAPYNVRLGARYLRRLLERFGEHPALAAAAYNAGPQALSRWLESGEALPLDVFVARIPYPETRGYVHRVLGNLARYAYLAGGEAAVPALELAVPKGKRALPDDF